MKITRNNLLYFALVVLAAAFVAQACKKGTTIGAVGYPDPNDPIVFDTFTKPDCRYFFYGKFDGKYRVWCDSQRSKWDTITRFDPGDGSVWSEWDDYFDNVYYNFCDQTILDSCPKGDSMGILFEHHTEFIRTEFPGERIEIFFYDCIGGELDEIPAVPGRHGLTETSLFITPKAMPFSDVDFARYGAQIKYTDSNRVVWTTKAGSGQTNDSYIRIKDFYYRDVTSDTLDTFGLYIIEGTFAGRLFNGNMELPITEAEFRARLVPQVNP